jgi:glycosyltransferase involved in cell wall biosynthesis
VKEKIEKLNGKAIYVCYFGLREPLVQTQVLPYIRQICKTGIRFSLLTFETNPKEKWTNEEINAEKQKLSGEGINWDFLTYHKSPSVPATIFDIFNGSYFLWKFIRRERPDVIHARVHVPALMGAIAKKISRKKVKLLFDIRGFFPEEYTDAGRWKKDGWLYHSVKRIEKWLLKVSDGFVVLTEKGRRILFPKDKTGEDKNFSKPVEVIPCCVDFKGFENLNRDTRRNIRERLKLTDRYVIIYVGSFGGWYMTDEMLEFFAAARKHNAKAFTLILTQRDQEQIAEKLKSKGFSENDYLVTSSSPTEIPEYLSGADVALSFIEACYSKQASSPTKIAEYLASGLPVVLNPGVGDLDELVETDKVAVTVSEFDEENYSNALKSVDILRADPGFSEKCRESAKRRFDLYTVGGERYRRLYKMLLDD